MSNPLPASEVSRRVGLWLSDSANVESLKDVFAEADRLAAELARRSIWPPVSLGRCPVCGKPNVKIVKGEVVEE